jgi:hypothetical protein
MRNQGLFCLLLTCIAFGSCKKNESEKIIEAKEAVELESVACYQAVYEQDTINLKMNTFKNGEITGEMIMSLEDMPKKIGEIAGEFRGDTLFASYTFIQGDYKKKTFKNPMAFLKQGDQLILGNGEIENYMGASYFVKGKPIDFENVKYKLSNIECVD